MREITHIALRSDFNSCGGAMSITNSPPYLTGTSLDDILERLKRYDGEYLVAKVEGIAEIKKNLRYRRKDDAENARPRTKKV